MSFLGNKLFREETIEWDGSTNKVKLPRLFNWVIFLFIINCLWSSWYTVDKDENAVIRLLGKHVRTEAPGIHGKLPWPFETAKCVSVTKVRRMEIGFRTKETGPPAVYEDVPEEGEMLTGDKNIAELDFIVQFQVVDAAKWLFTYKEPEQALNYLAQSAMRLVVGRNDFEWVATDGRQEIQSEVQEILANLCRQLNFGPSNITVQLQDVVAPELVMVAFKDVNSAKEDKDRLVQEAEAYKNDKLPKARGDAEIMIQAAKADSIENVRKAKGEADRFLAVLREYKKQPNINKLRLTLETAEKVLPGSDIWILRQEGLLQHLDLKKSGQ